LYAEGVPQFRKCPCARTCSPFTRIPRSPHFRKYLTPSALRPYLADISWACVGPRRMGLDSCHQACILPFTAMCDAISTPLSRQRRILLPGSGSPLFDNPHALPSNPDSQIGCHLTGNGVHEAHRRAELGRYPLSKESQEREREHRPRGDLYLMTCELDRGCVGCVHGSSSADTSTHLSTPEAFSTRLFAYKLPPTRSPAYRDTASVFTTEGGNSNLHAY
jgi:hypothetical protein